MQKQLKDWQVSVNEGLMEDAYPPPSVEKRALLEFVRSKIQHILDGKVEEGISIIASLAALQLLTQCVSGEETDSDSDEEFEVTDGMVFLPRYFLSCPLSLPV